MGRRVLPPDVAGNAALRLALALSLAVLVADIAASNAQELPSGGGPLPSLRRGANGQIEVIPAETATRSPSSKRTGTPAPAAPRTSSPRVGGDVAAPKLRAPVRVLLPAGPQPVITVSPNAPSVPDTTRRGAVVASYSVKMSDNSPFAGTVRFGPPYYDSKGKFALRDNKIIVNPNGPGIGPNRATVTDHVTLEAIPENQLAR